MKTALYKLLKEIDVKELTSEDKEELLRFFMVSQNPTIRDQIAFVLADAGYKKATPFILERINQPELMNNNAGLVYALSEFDMRPYFIDVIKIICTQEYLARQWAYQILADIGTEASDAERREACMMLETTRVLLEAAAEDKGENSRMHFVESSIELLCQ